MMVEEFTSLPSLPDLDGVVPTSDLDMNFDFNAFAAQIRSDGSPHAFPSPLKSKSGFAEFGDLGLLSAGELFELTAGAGSVRKSALPTTTATIHAVQPHWDALSSSTTASLSAAVAAALPPTITHTHFLKPGQDFVGLLPMLSECTSSDGGVDDAMLPIVRGVTPDLDLDSPVSYLSSSEHPPLLDGEGRRVGAMDMDTDARGRSSADLSDIEAISDALSDALSDSDGESSSYGSGLSSAGASPVYGVALSTPHNGLKFASTSGSSTSIITRGSRTTGIAHSNKVVPGGANKCAGKEARKGWKCSADFMVKSITPKERTKLIKQGITPPAAGADGSSLTKAHERELRTALRKIRNVQSAQKSRRNQKEYIATLEAESAAREAVMEGLQSNVASLSDQNSSLLSQLAYLRSMVTGGGTGTALLMLVVGCGISVPAGGAGPTIAASNPAYTLASGSSGRGASFAPAGFQSRTLSGLAASGPSNGYGLEAAAASGAWGWTAFVVALALVLMVVALVGNMVAPSSSAGATSHPAAHHPPACAACKQDSSEVEEQPVVEQDSSDELDSDAEADHRFGA